MNKLKRQFQKINNERIPPRAHHQPMQQQEKGRNI